MLYYVTGNRVKFAYGSQMMAKFGIDLVQKAVDIVEIQADKVEDIALHKAQSAYELIQAPLIVNDAAWNFHGLKGFPGPYMSWVENWLTTADFLRLMEDVSDRRVTLTEVLVYIDEKTSKVFASSVSGEILTKPDGESDFKSVDPIVSFRSDHLSLAAARRQKISVLDEDFSSWASLAQWYTKNKRGK